jgi:hypothetical protein
LDNGLFGYWSVKILSNGFTLVTKVGFRMPACGILKIFWKIKKPLLEGGLDFNYLKVESGLSS